MLRLVEKHGKFHISGKYMGKQVRKTTGYDATPINVTRAERKLAEETIKIYHDVQAETGDKTIEDAIDHYIKWMTMRGKWNNKRAVDVNEWGRLLAGKKLKDITNVALRHVVVSSMSKLQASTIRRKLGVVSAILNEASRAGMCESIKVDRPVVDDARDLHLHIDEIESLLQFCYDKHEELLLPLLVLIDTGVRVGELAKMKWRNVGTDSITVGRVVNGKTKMRNIPMSKRLKGWMSVWRKGKSSSELVFGNGTGDYIGKRVAKVIKEWGQVPELRVHDLRHTFAYQAAYYGCDLGELQVLLGHSNVSMTMRYRGFVRSKAVDTISKFGSGCV